MSENIVEIVGEEKIRELVKIQKNFDINLVDFNYGFDSKIYPFISSELLNQLKNEHPAIWEDIVKAGILYSFVLDIPKIKVHISNYGISQHEQGRAKNAAWWDVRDLGISWLKKADAYLLKGLIEIQGKNWKKNEIDFFQKSFKIVDLKEINKIFPIQSVEAYQRFEDLMKSVLEKLMSQFGGCSIDDFLQNPTLERLIKGYIMHQGLLEAMSSPSILFLNSGMVIQYEELPWQKSAIIPPAIILDMSKNFQKKANDYLELIFSYINENKEDFPCYEGTIRTGVKIVRGKGGVFM